MHIIEKKDIFNEDLEGRLISVVGGEWSGYFFVKDVHQCELTLTNHSCEEVTLFIQEVTSGIVTVDVLPRFSDLTKCANEAKGTV